ncbi:hypothetical protein K443DRAFT_547221 [Laccaria amethystina LaAM-08-1]|uniref:Uncharacterized protein n=1 Tax=Laccaria amethystina LaAM-08-1 TaxID=1095629 RepID=A0A0C9WSH0_9AGAR|nr:hypothetical protein K443DRAFT_547221 [Laccaria amethystina LaAM-08-1]
MTLSIRASDLGQGYSSPLASHGNLGTNVLGRVLVTGRIVSLTVDDDYHIKLLRGGGLERMTTMTTPLDMYLSSTHQSVQRRTTLEFTHYVFETRDALVHRS